MRARIKPAPKRTLRCLDEPPKRLLGRAIESSMRTTERANADSRVGQAVDGRTIT